MNLALEKVERVATGGKELHGLPPKKLYTSVVVTPAPVQVPTQQLLVSSFTLVVV